MKIAVFWGCRILTSQYAYEMSVRQVLPKFDVKLVDLPETSCCGDPVKSVNDLAANYLAARVLAITNTTGSDTLLVPCNRCHFTISEARERLERDETFRKKVNNLLKEERLECNPDIEVWHVIDFLHDVIGKDRIRNAVEKTIEGFTFATHPGCQIFRYRDLGRPDDAENPQKLDELVKMLGAETIEYAEKLDCCGSALMHSHPDSALSLTGTKINTLQELKADGLVVSCPDCGLMYDFKQKEAGTTLGTKLNLPVLYYTQLLGLSMNIGIEDLGLHLNQSPIKDLLAHMSH